MVEALLPRIRSFASASLARLERAPLLGFVSSVVPIAMSIIWRTGGSNRFYDGAGGDHYYYVSHAHMLSGAGVRDAFDLVVKQFPYASPPAVLDFEWLDPAVSPLVYSRTFLPQSMNLFMRLFGSLGVWLPSIIFGLIGQVALWKILRSYTSVCKSTLLLGCLSMSLFLNEVRFGLYTEAPLIALVSINVYVIARSFELAKPHVGVWILVLSAPLFFLIRQAGVLCLFVGVGVVITSRVSFGVIGRRLWVAFFALLILILAGQFVSSRWAPYNPWPYAMYQAGTASQVDWLQMAPIRFAEIVIRDLFQLLPFVGNRSDFVWLTAVIFGVAVLARCRNARYFPLAVSVAAPLLLTTVLNGRPAQLRYLTPLVPVILLVAVSPKSERRDRIEFTMPRPRDRATPVLASFILIVGVASIVGTYLENNTTAPVLTWKAVTRDDLRGGRWNLTVERGFTSCAGKSLEAWFKTPEGTIYALSGPALKRRFFTPSIEALSIRKPDQLSSYNEDLLSFALLDCGVNYRGKIPRYNSTYRAKPIIEGQKRRKPPLTNLPSWRLSVNRMLSSEVGD